MQTDEPSQQSDIENAETVQTLPYVIAIAAMTLDGKIARDSDHLSDWTSREDKKLFIQATKDAGAVIFGRKTFDTLPQPLKGRREIIMTSNPELPIGIDESVTYSHLPLRSILEMLAKEGYEKVIIAGGASIYRQFIEQGLVNELWVTIEPVLFGKGISLLGDEQVDIQTKLLEVRQLNDNTVLLRYSFT